MDAQIEDELLIRRLIERWAGASRRPEGRLTPDP